nr:hypothetical protein Ccrd_017495 [Ipomoea batatas]
MLTTFGTLTRSGANLAKEMVSTPFSSLALTESRSASQEAGSGARTCREPSFPPVPMIPFFLLLLLPLSADPQHPSTLAAPKRSSRPAPVAIGVSSSTRNGSKNHPSDENRLPGRSIMWEAKILATPMPSAPAKCNSQTKLLSFFLRFSVQSIAKYRKAEVCNEKLAICGLQNDVNPSGQPSSLSSSSISAVVS